MKKGGFLRNVLDTIRSSQANQSTSGGQSSANGSNSREFGGQLKPQHFALAQVARHGFPENPTALAFDPVQKIAAIGTKTGALRVFGRPGVDVWAQHKPEYAVTHVKFVVNQGAIITVTADESIHLWSLRGPNLRLQHSQNSSPSTSSSPAQASISPGPQQQQQQQQQQYQTAASSLSATTHQSARLANRVEPQPGDPNYLVDQLASSSPTYDKSKQYPRQPEILHTLKFQREHITCLHQTLNSKWLYIGTERGNVHVANVETFELSGYSIAWNKAIELCRKTHPGSIIHISECPQDTNKLLIGYESGCIVLWDLKGRNAEGRYYHADNLLWLSWHYEGKQFVAAHGDGSLVTWQTRSNARPANILHPHAKTPSQSNTGSGSSEPSENLLNFQQQSSSAFMTRALNNELYRPINKVDWKTSRKNEQFLLFSGGLPYDGLEGFPSSATAALNQSSRAASVQPMSSGQPSAQQYLKPSSVSHNPSPISPSSSPAMNSSVSGTTNEPATSPAAGLSNKTSRQSQLQQQQQQTIKERKSLRSTSLTVMYGKSITVLEMDDTIIDFITICDNSPYENDTSDPQAVIILLSNELILIDLTSSGYPSFDSPYPSANLNESPVTCVQYLADCSSDLIPFLYSTSQNVVSRMPKKGFSDKEWPINGGEWGQQMQSYPELVVTGHADGTIKFWDMSGVNFDLISKIKTSKFFERPNKLRNSTIIAHNQALLALSKGANNASASVAAPGRALASSPRPLGAVNSGMAALDQSVAALNLSDQEQQAAANMGESSSPLEENPFAIEKIEYFPSSKHLVVAGALSQVIQFRINKKDSQGYPVSSSSPPAQETTTIIVDPTHSDSINQPCQQRQQQQQPKHLLLKVKNPLASGATGSSSGESTSSSSSSNRARSSGFQAELICLTPSCLVSVNADLSSTDEATAMASGEAARSFSTSAPASVARQLSSYYCVVPPKVTALAFQATHNILAYAHENGIVLVDIIQKCVIMSASLSDLYGGASMMQSNHDISIQPFATSSILQHHYQATVGSSSDFNASSGISKGFASGAGSNNSGGAGTMLAGSDNGSGAGSTPRSGETEPHQMTTTRMKTDNENGITNNNGPFHKPTKGTSNDPGVNQAAAMLMDLRPGQTTSDDTDNGNDKDGRGEQANELAPAKDHVKEASSGSGAERGSLAVREERQQLATTTKTDSDSRAARSRELEVSAVTFSTAASRDESTNRDSGGNRQASVAAPRAQLAHTKSVSGGSGLAAHDWQPVAPPRARKRQSVPFARVPSELVARHNAVLAGGGVVAVSATELAGSQVERAAPVAAKTSSSSSHPASRVPAAGSAVLNVENDDATKKTKKPAAAAKVSDSVVAAEIDSSCAPQAESPISSGEPQATASSVPQLLAPKTSSCSTAPASAADHQSAPSAGSGAGSTISSIFNKIMGKSQSSSGL